jgi:hypothetical protein
VLAQVLDLHGFRKKTTMLPSQESRAAPNGDRVAERLAAVGKQHDQEKRQQRREGISQIMVSSRHAASYHFKQIDLVGGDGAAAAVDGNDQRQADRHFSRSHRQTISANACPAIISGVR